MSTKTTPSAWPASTLALVILGLLSPLMAAQAAGLTDTGQTLCYNGSAMVTCDAITTGDSADYPAQDGRFGRDAAAVAGQLSKTGGGEAGFDYTKVCNSGELAGSGSCPANPALGSGKDDWGCTKDNVTDLIWEVKINDATHLRHKEWSYTWYRSNSTTNGGDAGTADGTDNCLDTARCDTEKYVTDVNTAGLCGNSDWRMPYIIELQTLTHYGKTHSSVPFDKAYFPNTNAQSTVSYWSATSLAILDPSHWAWAWKGSSESLGRSGKSTAYAVRLVRGGHP